MSERLTDEQVLRELTQMRLDGHTEASQPTDAFTIISQDRDEWKNRALMAEAMVAAFDKKEAVERQFCHDAMKWLETGEGDPWEKRIAELENVIAASTFPSQTICDICYCAPEERDLCTVCSACTDAEIESANAPLVERIAELEKTVAEQAEILSHADGFTIGKCSVGFRDDAWQWLVTPWDVGAQAHSFATRDEAIALAKRLAKEGGGT